MPTLKDRLPPWLRLLRPHQWVKNSFVLVGLLFGHAWNQPHLVLKAVAATAAFCLLSSAVYVFNDLMDREQDRLHPEKRHRPLASGTISVPFALALMVLCLVFAMDLVFRVIGYAQWVFLSYLCVNIAYTIWLKQVVILDIFLISAGFMLRLLAGTLAIGIPPSQWLLLCGMMLTLFLGFAKRRAELNALHTDEGAAGAHRRVLAQYSPHMLDQLITVAAACTVISYSLYTVSPDTEFQHSGHFWITVPFVMYGMFRYLYLLHRGGGGDAAEALLNDRHLVLAVLGWLLTTLALLTGHI